jgi:hypothetical protein
MIANVVVEGDASLVHRLGPVLEKSLGPYRRLCAVHLYYVGQRGDIILAVEGTKGRAPLILTPEEQLPELVANASQRLLARVSD